MHAQLSISSCKFPLSHLHLADVSTERAGNNVLSGTISVGSFFALSQKAVQVVYQDNGIVMPIKAIRRVASRGTLHNSPARLLTKAPQYVKLLMAGQPNAASWAPSAP